MSGAHLSDWHGNTLSKIENDGFKIVEKIDNLLMTNRETQRSKGVGLLIEALTQTIEREQPDLLFVVGDREESIATSIVGNYMNVLVAHLGGGDPVYGNADDPIRFACSKLSHIHIVTSRLYAENLIKVGEEDYRICNSGNPALANIFDTKEIDKIKLSKFLNFDIINNDYIVLLKHPLSSEVDKSFEQMKITLDSVKEFSKKYNFKVVGIYPNTDPGAYNILKAINDVKCENIKFYKTLPRDIFINLIRATKCLVGNSSMGILEAPYYRLPVVNVGNRQQGRLNAGNVKFVNYNKEEIIEAIETACFDEVYIEKINQLENPFGDETAPDKIIKFIREINISEKKWYIKSKLC